jgi:4-amino-4-deoxy-L-arabinose transferase-like glycosyltransferase
MTDRDMDRRSVLALLLFCGAGLALRLWGLDFGLPLWSNYYVRPDESLIVEPALRVGQDPRFFFYPALMSLVSGVVFTAYHAVSAFDPTARTTIAVHAGASLDTHFLLARGVSAVAGALMAVPVYFAATSVGGRRAGLTAAALVTVAPLAVREAHYGVTDTLLATFVAVTLGRVLSLRYARRRIAALFAVALALGLTVAAKYTGVFVVPAVVVGALLTASPGRRLRDVAIVAVIALTTFVAVNPYLFAHIADLASVGRVLVSASYERTAAAGPWSPVSGFLQLWWPLTHGPALWCGGGLALLGAVWSLRTPSHRTMGWIGLAALAGIGAPLFLAHVVPYRYVLPLVPVVAVFAGVALTMPVSRTGRTMALALTLTLVARGAWESARLDRLLAREDTRSEAGRWIAANVPAACAVVMWASPELEPQVRETSSSIQRRIEYVHALYGATTGELVSRLYRVALAGATGTDRPPAYEVYRSMLSPADAPCSAIVTAGYPGFVAPAVTSAELAAGAGGSLVRRASFSPFAPGIAVAPIEPLDAFFLPMEHLDRVIRPGPIVEIVLYQR